MVNEREGLRLDFDGSLSDTIYQEGVYPLQGARPIYSSIDDILKSKLGSIIARYRSQTDEVQQAWVYVEEEALVVQFFDNYGNEVDRISFTISKSLGKLKESPKDQKQCICGVHEAAHATISIALMGVVPDAIVSKSLHKEMQGFTCLPRNDEGLLTKKDLELRGKMLMAGITGEQLVFGLDQITHGSGDDLQKATEIALRIEKQWGMGTGCGAYFANDNEGAQHAFKDAHGYLDRLAKDRVEHWKKEAQRTLRGHWRLFMELADRLSEVRKLKKDEVRALLEEVEPMLAQQLFSSSDKDRFRGSLKEKVKESRQGIVVEEGAVNGSQKKALG
jgi:cell division protease FtsH